MEPEKWQNREEKILRGVEGGQDLGRGDGNHIPHPDHALHPLRELLDDLDAVESLAKKTKKSVKALHSLSKFHLLGMSLNVRLMSKSE